MPYELTDDMDENSSAMQRARAIAAPFLDSLNKQGQETLVLAIAHAIQAAPLEVFCRTVLIPFLGAVQSQWDLSAEAATTTPTAKQRANRRATITFRMRGRLEAVLKGQPDPGPARSGSTGEELDPW
jgi:hypothetical protein